MHTTKKSVYRNLIIDFSIQRDIDGKTHSPIKSYTLRHKWTTDQPIHFYPRTFTTQVKLKPSTVGIFFPLKARKHSKFDARKSEKIREINHSIT